MSNDNLNIGIRKVWGGEKPFGLSRADRRQHLYAIGKTGTGKSTLLRNLIVQDIEAGEGVAVIDPHGDLAEELLNFIPPWRTDHVVYFDPADERHSVGLNLVGRVPGGQRHLTASGITSAFKSIWHDSWGPRLEYFLYACVAALLDCENVSLLGVHCIVRWQWALAVMLDMVLGVDLHAVKFEYISKHELLAKLLEVDPGHGNLLSFWLLATCRGNECGRKEQTWL